MSKQVNKTILGAFVVGAFLLLFVMVMLLGGENLFQKRNKYVIYFDGSIKGLAVGSPVKFRGVDVGEVTDINVVINSQDLGVLIPVYFEVYTEKIDWLHEDHGYKNQKKMSEKDVVETLIKQKGMKGQLRMQSMITGTLFIELDFYPDKTVELVGADKQHLEIPSIPTTLEVLSEVVSKFIHEFKEIPLDKMVRNLSETSLSINEMVNSPETRDVITNLNKALVDIQSLTKRTEGLAKKAEGLITSLDERVEPVASNLQETLSAARDTFASAEQTLDSLESGLGERAPLRRELMMTLNNVSDAARSISLLADYLQQHPEAIIKGKQSMEGGK